MKINEKNLIAYSTSREHVDKEGYLLIRGEASKTFQRRWFVLKGNLLFYFEKKGDKDPLGLIILEGCTAELAESEEHYVFQLIFYGANARTYEFGAKSQEELEVWMKYLSRASYDYLKLMVAELQKQLEEIEEAENSANSQVIVSPMTYTPLPTSNVFHKPRENPFNRNEETSYCDLWKCGEPRRNAELLLTRSASTSSGSVKVNPSLPPCIPFRPAPPPPMPPLRKNFTRRPFSILHNQYGVPILEDRKKYTSIILSSTFGKSCNNLSNDLALSEVKTENLIEL